MQFVAGDWVARARTIAGLLLLMAAQGACGTSRTATVESLEGAQPRLLPLSFSALEGRRDGDRVDATLVFQNPQERERLTIHMDIELGPPIRLAGGTFRLQGASRTTVGKVDAPSLDFQAGQSGGMGLGGRFLLVDAGRTLYRVNLPPTVMGASYQ